MDLEKVIKERRTIRSLEEGDISIDEMIKMLEVSSWAPSWANTQCWEVVLVKDENIKEELSSTLTPGNPAKEAVRKAPVVLAICGKKGVSGFFKGKRVTSLGDWLMFDVALFTQNLSLILHSKGMGSVIVGAYDIEKASNILGIPDSHQLVCLMAVGKPRKIPSPPKRKPIEEKVHINRWGGSL